ncbi:Sorting nexin-6 [Apis cerana cerana]|uniref:Sorting nexin n=1 Tax=Apis cerana cerana TaxID=94128 RepID=A0A2A3EIC4_APICC|nr:Sorting nexin-6 [Apis cerana cerana]
MFQDGICDTADILNNVPAKKTIHADNVDLSDKSLQVDISDALSEKDKVKFTVHTTTTLPEFQKPDNLVVRQHEEFVWLHDRFEENEEYAGYIIPPCPPRPDFDASREKLQKLGEGEGNMTREEFNKMKQELEAEYLATFKKTVAMHEMFLTRLAHHPVFRNDHNLRVFLEYDQDLCVRGKNKMEMFGGLVKSFSTTTDEYYLSATVKDVNDFFDQEMSFLQTYHHNLKEATIRADRQTTKHKDVADSYIKISTNLLQLATTDTGKLERFLTKIAEMFEKLRKVEGRVASDEDLKLSDTLRYYMRDTAAAKRLLFRRLKALHAYESANRALEKARAKNKDVHAAVEVAENDMVTIYQRKKEKLKIVIKLKDKKGERIANFESAEQAQTEACEKFEQMSEKGKEELMDFKTRRVTAFRKNLIELTELEIKHAKAHAELLKKCLTVLREE